jgi:hypothetical protein
MGQLGVGLLIELWTGKGICHIDPLETRRVGLGDQRLDNVEWAGRKDVSGFLGHR